MVIGGAAGTLARYGLGVWARDVFRSGFPWGTMIVNVSGSLLLGFMMHITERSQGAGNWRALLAIGFCGAYTTFSSFSYETARLMQRERWLPAAGNAIGNLLLSLICVFAGFALAAWVLQTGIVKVSHTFESRPATVLSASAEPGPPAQP